MPPLFQPAREGAASTAAGVSVAVDARGLDQSGIGRHLREILARLLPDPRFGRFILAGHPASIRRYIAGRAEEAKVEIVPFAYPFYSPAAHVRWGILEARGRLRADVAWFPHYDVPVTARGGGVVVVHDLIHFRLPELFPRAKRVIAAAVLRRAVRRGARVLVSSEATRLDLLSRHPEAAPRLRTNLSGVSGEFAAGAIAERVQGRPIAELRPYLLCVGNRKPHKNFVSAVETLAMLRHSRPDLRLVLVGASFDDDGVLARARARGQEEAIVEFHDVSEDELRGLYRGAEALIFPSLYEGFGLPLLEAMALGVPVVASDRASIPEVVGEAGLVVNALDAGAFAAALSRLREDAELRARLVAAGRERAGVLTWDASAARVADVLLEVAREG